MFRRMLLLGMAAVLAHGAQAEEPSEFYVVSEFFSDAGALFYFRVIEVKPDGPDVNVRYIRVAPLDIVCPRRTIIQAAQARLRGTLLAELIGQSNPCAVNVGTLNDALRRNSQRAGIFEAVSFGMVAQCGSQTRALGLPISESVRLTRLQRSHPEIAKLWDLYSSVVRRAFGEKDVFNDISAAEDLRLQRSGAEFVPSLMSGTYDQGLAEATKGGVGKWKSPSFRELLSGYQGPIARDAAVVPQLVNHDSFRFDKYVEPRYPALAKSARIQDKVELRLSVAPETGEVLDVEPLSGHAMLIPSSIAAARQWRFVPRSLTSDTVKVTIDYAFRCE